MDIMSISSHEVQQRAVPARSGHRHGWVVGLAGVAAGVTLMVGFPRLDAVARVVVVVALFHLVGLAVVVGSAWSVVATRLGRRSARRRSAASDAGGVDFGWSWGALNGPWLAAAALLMVALGLQLELPALWPAWFAVALLGVISFIGGLLLRSTRRLDAAPLPLVDLLASDRDRVLDAGCGGGRTTLALAKVLGHGRVVAVDRFDAAYIDGGGRGHLERNLRIAGLTDRVQIERADLTALPFPDADFDSAVSAHVLDHLGAAKRAGLAEIRRVLRPGGRLLVVVWVPGWVTFSLANVLCLWLTTKAGWRRLATDVGFTIRDEGTFSGLWFAVLERPGAAADLG